MPEILVPYREGPFLEVLPGAGEYFFLVEDPPSGKTPDRRLNTSSL
jgi:hypothetical protein